MMIFSICIFLIEECSKFGDVKKFEILKDAEGKALITFSSAQEAGLAASTFNGRYFSGRVIKSYLFPEGED